MGAIAVDWSGARRPAGKIWIAEAFRGSLRLLKPLRSRDEAAGELLQHLHHDSAAVAGLDFGFSLPAWFSRQHSLSSAFDLWGLVSREGERWLQECSWPFWGRRGKTRPELEAHFRRSEEQVGRTSSIGPKSTFQIGGAGAVGTGSIRGMPFLTRIREQGFPVWPFDPPQLPLVIEIYPRVLTGVVVKSSEHCREEYLAARWPKLPATLTSLAVQSEDAFDAAVSALTIDAHLLEFDSLPKGDEISRLEGEIWAPLMLDSSATMSSHHRIFVAGVPATGKSWLGQWLAENRGYIHIDAERAGGCDFDRAGIHGEWDNLISTGRANQFVRVVQKVQKPLVVNWGFPTCYLYIVKALQAEGFSAWWFHAPSDLARRAFVTRGGIDPVYFDRQMADIEREWPRIASVFGPHIVEGLHHDGSQRRPEEIWRDIRAAGF